MTKSLKYLLIITTVFLVAVAAFLYYRHLIQFPETDDAYVKANISQIASQVSGKINKIYVTDNQKVNKNDKLFEIDQSSFIYALEKAQANLKIAKQNLGANIEGLKAASANIEMHKAQLNVDKKNYNRIKTLFNQGQTTAALLDDTQAKMEVTQASLTASKNNYLKLKNLIGDEPSTSAEIQSAKAALDDAELNLKHTIIYASDKGAISNFNLRPGDVVQAGQNLFSIIEDNSYWVAANFKETQLTRIKIGQEAIISIDMYPNKKFNGVVESISSGSGSTFSVFPAENASGNWVKVTQRFSVRIKITENDPNYPLRVGASCTVEINTNS